MESIEQGSEPRQLSPRLRVALIGAVAAALALGALAGIVDARWRERTTDDLAKAFDETVRAIEAGERRVGSMMEYARPARERADVAPDVRASLDALVRDAAIEEAADIAEARARVDAIMIPPWHDELAVAREEADTWLALRATGITSLAEQGRATYPPREEIDAAREALRTAWAGVRGD